MPKKVGRGMPEMPSGPFVNWYQLSQHARRMISPNAERDDRQIVAAQPQHREAEDQTRQPAARMPASGRHSPEAEPKLRRQQRVAE